MTEEKFIPTRKKCLIFIERYLKANKNITAENFGWIVLKDASLVSRLRAGGDITTRKYDDIIQYLMNPNQERKRKYVRKKAKESGEVAGA